MGCTDVQARNEEVHWWRFERPAITFLGSLSNNSTHHYWSLPAELLLGQRPRTRLDLLRPSVELNDGRACQRHQDQIRKCHDPVDTAPMPTIVEPPDQVTSVPPATATLSELTSSDEVPSLSPQRTDSTEHSHPQAPVVEEAPTTRCYPARDRRPHDRV